ncbi:acetaldehyde dehydrogenase (acetylating) [Clostridium sporogenes]|uniref:Acetaldehyde dehydrogenase (Acetylating) n=1 Tax=Clostridium botulinum TaxID=1491 RepID=A0A6M0T234_CLOBO|nr:acetaldehyde dehydrogenase (acetylating) [Clostridium sporogenes]NFA60221.1 acetaldehyde dehydrogenase (acetylating) [Clostridium botulinum]NFI72804.1 acetaldehyde dehydrogenase (acetylating) [Clostridium sporogenes]NFL72409.1 acetaldehyde dehydrogenase (acetylating) [Clostridium sporogenes]NFM23422.1 acetaldehyde dehydrogenase (acetylating) [Clostridium sporogenes]NFP60217.1 acetaldehyde dehydrogenase (acetylating) [Clostridium sporogenes]
MEILDKDLISIQEVRKLIARSKKAQKELAKMSGEELDRITKAIADAGYENAVKLAKMAKQETGFGKWEDKVIKNTFASKTVYESMKDVKTVGIISDDKEKKVMEVGVPIGVIAGLIPSTNPTSTVIYKAMISIKGGNSIVFSPHPGAKKCILETVKIISEAAEKAGCPKDAILSITVLTMQATDALMKHDDVSLILATGGSAMVKAAYSSGTPAIGVGPGNGPAFIEKSTNVSLAVKRILDSKTFDNGTICASEQSIVVEKCMEETVVNELKKQGAYFLTKEQNAQLSKYIMRDNGTMNPQIVGKSVEVIAKLSNIDVPKEARVLIAYETEVGSKVPYSREKLSPILAFYVENDLESAIERCVEILNNEGAGHTCGIHSENQEVIREFGVRVPVSRVLVNTPGTLGGIGASTNIAPALTLGCGAIGGSSTSDNIGPLNLINIKRITYGIREIEDLRDTKVEQANVSDTLGNASETEELISLLVKRILTELK